MPDDKVDREQPPRGGGRLAAETRNPQGEGAEAELRRIETSGADHRHAVDEPENSLLRDSGSESGSLPRDNREFKAHPKPARVHENWTDLAPPPPPLATGKNWHVFISYRSANRSWAIALYDILNGLGYKVFLDQYVLTAAAPLALSLGEALETSQSAILIWSRKYEDSEWLRKEFAALETIEHAKNGFHYVIVRVDDSQMPGFAAAKLWIDFSQQPEGPGGSGLLRMLYGLQNKPLPPEAVKLAAKVDGEMQDGLFSVKACRDAGDAEGLVVLTATNDMAWTGSPMLLCAAAEGLIAMKKIPEALNVLDLAEQAFQNAVRPKQLRGLALARSGETLKAQFVLGKLYAAGEIGPETLGILAQTWMDRYNQTGNKTLLVKSRDLYRQAFEAFPSDYFTGINAASKSLMLGEKETAAQLAKRVQDLVGNKAVPGDYWRTATVADVQLLQGNFDAAGDLYIEAVMAAPYDLGSHESVYGQTQELLVALGATQEQKAKIAAAFRTSRLSVQDHRPRL
jgi:TIR domain/MAP3K TRAFs-binding domain